MKSLAIAIIVVIGTIADLAILAGGAWVTFVLGFSLWWWLLVAMFSWGETVSTYKFVNAVNGIKIPLVDQSE